VLGVRLSEDRADRGGDHLSGGLQTFDSVAMSVRVDSRARTPPSPPRRARGRPGGGAPASSGRTTRRGASGFPGRRHLRAWQQSRQIAVTLVRADLGLLVGRPR
jgi:hypothetical protein